MQPASVTPGRERWWVDVLRGRYELARLVEEAVSRERGIRDVGANSVTSRVLVLFDASLSSEDVERIVRRAVENALTVEKGRANSAARASGVALGGATGTFAAGVLLSRAFIGPAVFSLPVLVGAGVLVTSVVIVVRSWSETHWAHKQKQAIVLENYSGPIQRHPFEHLLAIAKRYRRRFIVAAVCSSLTRILDLTPSVLLGFAVTILAGGPSSFLAGLGFATVASQLWVISGVSALSWIIESGIQYYASITWRNLGQSVQRDIRVAVYAHVQRLGLGYFEDERTGDLASIINDDVNQLQLFLNEGANHFVHVLTNLLIMGPLFYLVAPSIAWIAVLPIPVIVWISFNFEKWTAESFALAREKSAIVSGQLVGNLDAIATIKTYSTEAYEVERIRKLSDEYKDSYNESDEIAARFTPMVRAAILFAFSGTMVVGGYEVLGGRVAPGTYASIISMTHKFVWPLSTLGDAIEGFERAVAALSRALGLLDIPVAVDLGTEPLPAGSVRGEIVFDHVEFSYQPGRPILSDFSMRVPAGKTTAIVGSTGAGKTTIIKALLRLYEIQDGHITIDGVNVSDIRLPDLRRAIGYVSQDVFLFDGTVHENITYGSFDALDHQIEEAALLAEADAFIRQLPNGYDTVVGERGVKLSGGQRQRISLARAILKDPPVLILDEATSSVDYETEAAIQLALEHVSISRTVIIIAHRLSTVRHADVIYVLGPSGRVEEEGRHDELLALNGIYASLWRVQSGLAVSHGAG